MAHRKNSGFTLIELMIVISIILILVSIAINLWGLLWMFEKLNG